MTTIPMLSIMSKATHAIDKNWAVTRTRGDYIIRENNISPIEDLLTTSERRAIHDLGIRQAYLRRSSTCPDTKRLLADCVEPEKLDLTFNLEAVRNG